MPFFVHPATIPGRFSVVDRETNMQLAHYATRAAAQVDADRLNRPYQTRRAA